MRLHEYDCPPSPLLGPQRPLLVQWSSRIREMTMESNTAFEKDDEFVLWRFFPSATDWRCFTTRHSLGGGRGQGRAPGVTRGVKDLGMVKGWARRDLPEENRSTP